MRAHEYVLDDDIVAIATALSPAALGIVRTSGSSSIERVASFFSRAQALTRARAHTFLHGWILDGKTRVDEVVLLVYRAPHSFTGEHAVEIICHGGVRTVQAVYRLCLAQGFRAAQRGEFSFRSFFHGKRDLTRIEAIQSLVDARTCAAQQQAVLHLSGALQQEIAALTRALLAFSATLQGEIEYPEDEETRVHDIDMRELEPLVERLRRLRACWQERALQRTGVRIVLGGCPNAGKSSLFNALLGQDRAIVSSVPGTTRDWLEADLDLSGIPVRLCDTAGLRVTDNPIEAQGVVRSEQLLQGADCVFYIINGRAGVQAADCAFLSDCAVPLVVVVTHNDLMSMSERTQVCQAVQPFISAPVLSCARSQDARGAGEQCLAGGKNGEVRDRAPRAFVCVSAKTHAGLDALRAQTLHLLHGGQVPYEELSLGSERQYVLVDAAVQALEHAQEAYARGFGLDAVVHDLEEALYHCGALTGEVHSEDILDALFEKLCVGK